MASEHSNIAWRRLCNQALAAPRFQAPREVVAWLGAVQAQDYPGAKWSLGLRMKSAVDAAIDDAFNTGSILRTHVLRPTWHFVLPEDIRWMLELTAPRVRIILSSFDRKLEIDERLRARAQTIFARVLGNGESLTRDELAHELEKKGIAVRGQRLGRIVMHAELDGLICSGPRRGKQFTYMLLDHRAPVGKKMRRDEAGAELAMRYFRSHGPAQLKDFSWWSGFTMKEATHALDSVTLRLDSETIDGKVYWFDAGRTPKVKPTTFLLSIYDEYVIAHKDRSALGGARFAEMFLAMGNALTSVLIIDGLIAGTWRRVDTGKTVELAVRPLRRLTAVEKETVSETAERYGRFLGRRVDFSLTR